VHFGSDRLAFTIWHSTGIVKFINGGREIDDNDDNAVVALELVFDLLPRFWWICWTEVGSFWLLILVEVFEIILQIFCLKDQVMIMLVYFENVGILY
jgi:hypothetical protein